jgi:hypothetical protein
MQLVVDATFAFLVAVGALFVPQPAAVVLLALIYLRLQRMTRV